MTESATFKPLWNYWNNAAYLRVQEWRPTVLLWQRYNKSIEDESSSSENEEDDNWDPDFDEFDVPKSKVKKATGGGAKKKDDDDLGLDDDFKEFGLFDDMDGGGGGNYDDDDDF